MLNWDLYTNPKSKEFTAATTTTEKLTLANRWKQYMASHDMYISFFEWYSSLPVQHPILKPMSAPIVCCPVKSLSLSELGKEINNLKHRQEREEEKDKDKFPIKHQSYLVLSIVKIQDLHFKLKTLLDTDSDLNLLNKNVISVSLWEKTDLTVTGLGNILNNISFYIPHATVCFEHFCLNVKFFLAEIPVACILGTPFLAVVSPHGSTQISSNHKNHKLPLESS